MLSLRRVAVLLLLLSALAGGFVGAAVYALVFDGDRDARGEVLRLPPVDSYDGIGETPACVPLQHFCLVVVEGGEVRALYTYDTHPYFRNQSCEVTWRPDMLFLDPETQQQSRGWFRANCSGTTYRYTGERVFGPGPRSMDEFAIESKRETVEGPDGEPFEIEYLEIDTRRLICGEAVEGAPRDCERAPRPE